MTEEKIMIRTEQIEAGRVSGHVAHAVQPRGGVLVLPTITGIDAFMRERAQGLAEAGFTAMVWNPYPGETPPPDLPSAQARALKLGDEVVDTMSDCVDFMLATLKLPAVAVLGFCLGGRYAILLAARDRRLFACVPYYPSIRLPIPPNHTLDAIALAADISCPVHMVHAGADRVFGPEAFARTREALERRPAATVVQIHPGAVHSFMRAEVQSEPANAAATRLSWPPAMAFLDACLNAPRAARAA
jgi:carboxymethylenebutenolidase